MSKAESEASRSASSDTSSTDAPDARDATAGDSPSKTRIASEEQLAAFVEVVESDPRICNNCFNLREETARHFRSSGGRATGGSTMDDQTADIFCRECVAGTGKPDLYRPHDDIDYSNVHCELGKRFIRDMGGTVERTWSEAEPLPKNGEQISFARLLGNLRDRLEEKNYDFNWGHAKRLGKAMKDEHPSRDRAVMAFIVTRCSDVPLDGGQA